MELQNRKIDIKIKLAALWATFMFLYIYVDHFALYMPNAIESIKEGRVYEFDITQNFIFIALSLAAIPIMMIFLSICLNAKINRITNLSVAILLIPYMLFNLAGVAWAHMYFAAALEVILLCLIIGYAWKWPKVAP